MLENIIDEVIYKRFKHESQQKKKSIKKISLNKIKNKRIQATTKSVTILTKEVRRRYSTKARTDKIFFLFCIKNKQNKIKFIINLKQIKQLGNLKIFHYLLKVQFKTINY